MQFVSGAIKLSNSVDSTGVDFLLLEIIQTIPPEFNLYYMGIVNSSSFLFFFLSPSPFRISKSKSCKRDLVTHLYGSRANFSESGWDARDIVPGLASTVTIHHPGGDYKKISFDDSPPTTGSPSGPENQWAVGEGVGVRACHQHA